MSPFDPAEWAAPPGPHVARTLGWTVTDHAAGRAAVTWTAGPEHGFPAPDGTAVVHGGLLAALLDNAMAAAAWTLTGPDAPFLTADLHVQLLRPARPGPLTATGEVVRSGRTTAACSGRLVDGAGVLLAVASATQVRTPPGDRG